MTKAKTRKAWVITWMWFGASRSVDEDKNPIYVLSPRFSADRIVTILRALYVNSPLTYLSERWRLIENPRELDQLTFQEGNRIRIGDDPFLTAWHVQDLAIEEDSQNRVEIVRWTAPSGVQFNREKDKIEPIGESRSYERHVPFPFSQR
jgi:hypothetical protein